jgi:hypothetical protein
MWCFPFRHFRPSHSCYVVPPSQPKVHTGITSQPLSGGAGFKPRHTYGECLQIVLSPSRPGQYLKQPTAASFHIPSESAFNSHPNTRHYTLSQCATGRPAKAPFRSAAFQASTAVRKQRAAHGSTDVPTDRLQLRRRRVVIKQQTTLPTYCHGQLSAAANNTADIH